APGAAKSDELDFASDLDNLFGDAPVKAAQGDEPTFDFDLASAFGESAEPMSVGGGVEVVDFDAAMADLSAAIPGSRDLPSADDLDAPTPFDLPAKDKPDEPAARARTAPTSLPNWGLEPVTENDGDDEATAPAKVIGVEKISAAESLLAGSNWSLEDVVEGDAAPAAPAPTGPAKFGLEKQDAQEYLAPQGGDEAKFDFDTSLKLDLIPLEEAVSPDRPELVSEHRLDESSGSMIRRVVVLGASIGGPEAVREYLSALPARFPALFVLAQHMGAEFLELMAAQLAKATPLTVRSPQHGDRVGHGEILVVPTTHRLLIEPSGVVQLAHLPEASPYTPSIDLVIRDMADRFKTAATAIIFSGMAHDAIDGSKHLASLGGKVWAQDPDTCVISSMVDGARDAGIVSYTGSPAELAQHTIATFKG
ncbi:MAG TPA: chemotaxis protein CheB, partial [Tahibacter sp.]|nr:chemotaxis protein CheB [Tahibacter sp.]